MNKYGLSPKGQYAWNWVKLYVVIILACFLIIVLACILNHAIAKVISLRGAGVSVTAAPVPFDFSHSPIQSPIGRSPLSAGGYLSEEDDK